MSPTLRFLIAFSVVYFAAGLTLNAALGPPGMSAEYLKEFKADHDRYLEAVKSDGYKLWNEAKLWGKKPERNVKDPVLAEKIVIVSEYEAREEFIAEDRRRGMYEIASDVFKVIMIVVLLVRFGRKPLLSLLDDAVSEIAYRIQKAEKRSNEAELRNEEAEQRVARLGAEGERIGAETEERIVEENGKVRQGTQRTLDQLARETEDRKRQEELKGRRALEEVLVDLSIEFLSEKLKADQDQKTDSALIEQFVDQLESSK